MVSVWEIESEKVHYGKLCDIQFKWGNAQTHNSPNRFLLAIFRSILFSIAKLWLLWISHGCYFRYVFVLCMEFNRIMRRINLTSMRMFIFNSSIEIIECRRCTLNFQLLGCKMHVVLDVYDHIRFHCWGGSVHCVSRSFLLWAKTMRMFYIQKLIPNPYSTFCACIHKYLRFYSLCDNKFLKRS